MIGEDVSECERFEVSIGRDAEPRAACRVWCMACGDAEPRVQDVLLELEQPVEEQALQRAEAPSVPAIAKASLLWGLALLARGRREDATRVLVEAILFASPTDSCLPSAVVDVLERFHPASGPRPLEYFDPLLESLLEVLLEAYRELAQSRPDVFFPDRCESLEVLVFLVSGSERPSEEIFMLREGLVNILRECAADHPDVVLPKLARELSWLATFMPTRDRALPILREAVEVHRVIDRNASGEQFARALAELGQTLSVLGRHDEALRCRQEVVDIHRHRVREGLGDFPALEVNSLARSLLKLGDALNLAGRSLDAHRVVAEAVERLRVQEQDWWTVEPLIEALRSLGERASDLGRIDEAVSHTGEAVGLLPAVHFNPPESEWLTLETWGTHGTICVRAGKYQEALDSFSEALRDFGPILIEMPELFPLVSRFIRGVRRACEEGGLPVPDELVAILEFPDPSS